jgi:hypothetical protein
VGPAQLAARLGRWLREARTKMSAFRKHAAGTGWVLDGRSVDPWMYDEWANLTPSVSLEQAENMGRIAKISTRRPIRSTLGDTSRSR